MSDPDIGMCDWCGSEDGVRAQVLVTVSRGQQPVLMWLCHECREERE